MKTLRQFVEEAKQYSIDEDQFDPEEYYSDDEDEADEDEELDEEAEQLDELTDDELKAYIAKGGKITIGKPGKMPHKPGLGQASRHIGGGRSAGRRGSGKAANTKKTSKLVVAKEEADIGEGVADFLGTPGPGSTRIKVSGTGNARQYSVNGQAVSQQQGQNAIAAGMNRAAASSPGLAAMRAQSSSSTTTSTSTTPRPTTPAPRPATTGTQSYSGGRMISQFEEAKLHEEHDIELKPHPTKKTHYVVHKIAKKSGIKSDQLKVGEALNDTHVDDLNDMGYSVKIHSK